MRGIMKSDPARAALRDVMARRAEMEVEAAKLRDAKKKAVAAIGAADLKHRKALAAVEAARADGAKTVALALAGGDEFKAPVGLSALRAAVADAEDERHVAEEALRALDEQIKDVEGRIDYLPIRGVVADAIEPKVRKLLDDLHDSETRRLQLFAVLKKLFDERMTPDELRGPIMDALGMRFSSHPVGHPDCPVKAPDTVALEQAIKRIQDDPESVLNALD